MAPPPQPSDSRITTWLYTFMNHTASALNTYTHLQNSPKGLQRSVHLVSDNQLLARVRQNMIQSSTKLQSTTGAAVAQVIYYLLIKRLMV